MDSLSNVESDIAAGEHDRDDPTSKVQRQGLAEDKVYVAHKMASTRNYPRQRERGAYPPPPPQFPRPCPERKKV